MFASSAPSVVTRTSRPRRRCVRVPPAAPGSPPLTTRRTPAREGIAGCLRSARGTLSPIDSKPAAPLPAQTAGLGDDGQSRVFGVLSSAFVVAEISVGVRPISPRTIPLDPGAHGPGSGRIKSTLLPLKPGSWTGASVSAPAPGSTAPTPGSTASAPMTGG